MRTSHPVDSPSSLHDSEDFPLVTVLVVCYNHEKFVSECLDSVLNTAYPNLQWLIFDDASPDRSDAMIRKWIQAHSELEILYVHHEQNTGLPRLLNEAITQVRGEYYLPLAADDALLPNGIIDRVRYLQQNPEKLAVFADCHVIDDEGNQIHQSGIEGLYHATGMKKSQLSSDANLLFNVLARWSVPGPVLLCRTEIFSVVGLFDEEFFAEDWDFYLRLAIQSRLGFIDRFVSNYRLHSQNAIYLHQERMGKDTLRVLKKNVSGFQGLLGIYVRLYIRRLELMEKGGNGLQISRLRLQMKLLFLFLSARKR